MDTFNISNEWLLWMLGVYNWLYTFTHDCMTVSVEIMTAVLNVFRPKYYIFFEGSQIPFNTQNISIHATGSAEPEWIYSPCDRKFFEWSRNVYNTIYTPDGATHFLPILSIEIIGERRETGRERGSQEAREDDETWDVQYDLTDFIENFRVHTLEARAKYPSIGQIIGAWSSQSTVYVDQNIFKARIMDNEANTHILDINDKRGIDQVFGVNTSVREDIVSTEEEDQEENTPTEDSESGSAAASSSD